MEYQVKAQQMVMSGHHDCNVVCQDFLNEAHTFQDADVIFRPDGTVVDGTLWPRNFVPPSGGFYGFRCPVGLTKCFNDETHMDPEWIMVPAERVAVQ